MRIWIVDAFADQAFAGAQSGVMPLDAWLSDDALAALAAECRMPEMAFFAPGEVKGNYTLRLFGPGGEVPISGHSALAAGAVLLEEIDPEAGMAVFDSPAGPLVVRRTEEGITLDLPRKARFPWDPPSGLAEALSGANIVDAFGAEYATVVLSSEAAVRRLEPDLAAIAKLVRGPRAGCLAVTAQADEDKPYDFVTRFFAPGLGAPEDSVMGASFADTAPYWADRLGLEDVVVLQCSKRGGVARATPSLSSVRLLGKAAIFLRGEVDGAVVKRLARRVRKPARKKPLPSMSDAADLLPNPALTMLEPKELEVRVHDWAPSDLDVAVFELDGGGEDGPALEAVEVRDLPRMGE